MALVDIIAAKPRPSFPDEETLAGALWAQGTGAGSKASASVLCPGPLYNLVSTCEQEVIRLFLAFKIQLLIYLSGMCRMQATTCGNSVPGVLTGDSVPTGD